MEAKLLKSHESFNGSVEFYTHASRETGTDMRFTVYRPWRSQSESVPVVYWLSGLTCTEENFTTKSGYQQYANQHGFIVVAPDTSPRGANIPGEDDDWDFGTGAGFYVDATAAPWAKNYNMYSYVTQELPQLIHSSFPTLPKHQAIMGHSMGGHGALIIALRNPDRFKSVSAFSPICAPCRVPWGQRAFKGYLGDNDKEWADWDATMLVAKANDKVPMLIDQGLADPFLEEQLKTDYLETACRDANYPVDIRRREGYDHSYFYISTFLGEHFAFHAEHFLRQ